MPLLRPRGATARSQLRENMARAIFGVPGSNVTGSTLLGSRAGSFAAGALNYFQDAPLTNAKLIDIYGTSEEFLQAYENFADRYYSLLQDKINLAKGVSVDVELEKSLGRIDFNFFNKAVQKQLHSEYMRDVLRIDKLVNKGKLPGVEMPSTNPFSSLHRYLVASEPGQETHAAKVLLNKVFFSYKDTGREKGLDRLSVGKSNILHPRNIRDTINQTQGMQTGRFDNSRIFGDVIEEARTSGRSLKVATLDIETTSTFRLSQMRSLAITEQTVDASGFGAPSVPGFNQLLSPGSSGVAPKSRYAFASPHMNNIMVGGPQGRPITDLINEISGLPPGTSPQDLGSSLDEMADLFERLTEYDRVVGHNLNFDLTKIVTTLQDVEGFGQHDRLKTALKGFFEKRNAGNFVYDTLDVAREYFNQKAMNVVEQYASGLDMDGQAQVYLRQILSHEILAKTHMGEGVVPNSMENIYLNSNLFHLIERDGQADGVYSLIRTGSHVENTDTVLQSYVAKYIQSGELDIDYKFDPAINAVSYTNNFRQMSNFERMSKARILQSSAITPTTNIADVGQLSNQVFDFIRQDLRGVTVNLQQGSQLVDEIRAMIDAEIQTAGQTLRSTTRGLSRHGLTYQLQDLRRQLFDQSGNLLENSVVLRVNDSGVIELLRAGSDSPISLGSAAYTGSRTHRRIGAAQRGNVSTAVQDYMKDMLRGFLDRARDPNAVMPMQVTQNTVDMVNPYNLAISSLGHSYESVSRAEQMLATRTAVSGIQTRVNHQTVVDAFSSVYREYGSGLSPADRTRVSSFFGRPEDLPFEAGLNNITFNTAEQVAARFAEIGDPFSFIDPNSRVVSTIVSDLTAGFGLSLNKGTLREGFQAADVAFSAQPKQMAELGLSYFRAQDESSIFRAFGGGQVPSKIIVPTEILQEAFDRTMTGQFDTMRQVGLSVSDLDDVRRVNLVWNIDEQLNSTMQRQLMGNLFDIFQDADEVARLMGKEVSDLGVLIQKDIDAAKSAATRISRSADPVAERAAYIEQFYDTAKRRGIVMGYLDDQATIGQSSISERLIRAFERMGIDVGTDTVIGKWRASILRTGLKETGSGVRGVVVTPMVDSGATRLLNLGAAVDSANTVVNQGGRIVSAQIDQYNEIANQVADRATLRQVTSNVRRAKLGDTKTVLADFYKANKLKIGLGLGISALAGFAYYRVKKHNENQLYDEVMEQQPISNVEREDPLKQIKETYNYAPIRSNPMATAGVVGGLDRNKIGHTRMGNNRNNHLFGMEI